MAELRKSDRQGEIITPGTQGIQNVPFRLILGNAEGIGISQVRGWDGVALRVGRPCIRQQTLIVVQLLRKTLFVRRSLRALHLFPCRM